MAAVGATAAQESERHRGSGWMRGVGIKLPICHSATAATARQSRRPCTANANSEIADGRNCSGVGEQWADICCQRRDPRSVSVSSVLVLLLRRVSL